MQHNKNDLIPKEEMMAKIREDIVKEIHTTIQAEQRILRLERKVRELESGLTRHLSEFHAEKINLEPEDDY